jgi:ribose transport system permease protein
VTVPGKHIIDRVGLDRFSGLYLWAAFIIIFGIWLPGTFLTISTAHSIGSAQAVAGIAAIAVLIPMCCGQFDLSVGANANLTGIIVVVLQDNYRIGVVPAILMGLLIGVFIGFVNGFIVVKLRVSSFIATLGMGSILTAFTAIVSNNQQPNPVLTPFWNNLTQYTVGGFQIIVFYLLLIAIIAWWLLGHTPFGRYLYAIGGNADAARLSGVRVERWIWTSLTIAGGVAGIGGILFTSQTGPSLSFGPGLLLPAFAAAFLGSTQLKPGIFNVWGTLLAIYVLATGVEGLQLVSGQQWMSDMFNGVALILAVALAAVRGTPGISRRRRQERRQDGAALLPTEDATAQSASAGIVASRDQVGSG